jgi:hypothetical protein
MLPPAGRHFKTPRRFGGPGAILGPWPHDDVSGGRYGSGVPGEIDGYFSKH